MAITDINISEKLEAGAPSIKYTGDMNPNIQEPNMQVASDPSWEAEWEDAYQNYKIKQIELGQEFVSKEEFMEDYQNNMASGGRAHFGLGSLIKKITKPIQKLAKSPIGKAALLGGLGMWGMGAGPFSGGKLGGGFLSGMKPWLFGQKALPGFPGGREQGTLGFLGKLKLTGGKGSMMPTALGLGTAAVGLGMGATAFEGMSDDQITELKNNPEALRAHLTEYHSNTHPEKSAEEVATWVETQMYSTGGRVGYASGSNDPRNMTTVELISIIKEGRSTPEMFEELRVRGIDGVKLLDLAEFGKTGGSGDVAYSFDERLLDKYDPKIGTSDESFLFKMRESNPEVYGKYTRPKDYPKGYHAPDDAFYKAKGGRIGYAEGNDDKEGIVQLEMSIADRWEKIKELMKKMEDIKSGKTTAPDKKAKGGRMGFAYGPDQTAQAAGMMEGLPTRNNAAGIKELDLRDSGGFIPPVGIKEKADDIPAMLSNNEFVFTADAVRAAGGGSVEKGAQVMYDTMKNLENKVV